MQLYSPSQTKVPHSNRITKKFENPKIDQYRYNNLYNKVNLSLKNEMNKFKNSNQLSPNIGKSHNIMRQAKILLNEPSMSVLNAGEIT